MNNAFDAYLQIKAKKHKPIGQTGELPVFPVGDHARDRANGYYSAEPSADSSENHDITWRKKAHFDLTDLQNDLKRAAELFAKGNYLESFDFMEQLADTHQKQSELILVRLYDMYQELPEKESRYFLYQQRLVDFNIAKSNKVIDIGSGHIPFPLATHLADLDLGAGHLGRAGIPFKEVDGKPVYTCSIEKTPFGDKEFDFVYTSHVLEHVDSPERACAEIQRIGKRGYIETPTLGKDIFLNTGKISNHRWYLVKFNNTLHFFEYDAHTLDGLNNNTLMKMHIDPQSPREKSLTSLLYLKADHFNTMFIWNGSFNCEVHRLEKSKSTASVPVSTPKMTERSGKHSIVFINTFYKKFLDSLYSQNPVLAKMPYDEQKQVLQSKFFGDSDYYSKGMVAAGWEAEDLIVNCAPLQQQWARENGLPVPQEEQIKQLITDQIKQLQPEIVYIQDMVMFDETMLGAIRPYVRIIAGQIATHYGNYANFPLYDVIFTSFPHFVKRFREQGWTTYYQPLAFESRVLKEIKNEPKTYPVTFVGGIGALHASALESLEYLAQSTPMEFFGYVNVPLPPGCAIMQKHHGEVWGIEMFRKLAQSRITFNRHVTVQENYANNMRLFEATGCGTLLVTDYKDNLSDLFEIGKEVVAYRSPEEAAALIQYYLQHPDEATQIALAGQHRTLKDHSYSKRMKNTAEILERHLRYQEFASQGYQLEPGKISTGYTDIKQSEISSNMLSGWKDSSIPIKQRILVQKELNTVLKGGTLPVFQVVVDMLKPLVMNGTKILETGCASGYYYEILSYLLSKNIEYTGVDYSEALIEMAKEYYPSAKFLAADGAAIPLPDEAFDIVLSSGLLIHVPNFADHIKESVRLASDYVLFHRTTTCRNRTTTFQRKFAYEVETVELIFNEDEIENEFRKNGLEIIEKCVYYASPADDIYNVSHLCRKLKPKGI